MLSFLVTGIILDGYFLVVDMFKDALAPKPYPLGYFAPLFRDYHERTRSAFLPRVLIGGILGLLFKFFLDRKFIEPKFIRPYIRNHYGGLRFLLYILPELMNRNMVRLQFTIRLVGYRPFIHYILFSFLILFVGKFLENRFLNTRKVSTNSP